jgi:hypothetical protein
MAASFSTPRNIVYKDKDVKIIDYFGRGVVLQEDLKRVYHIYSRERNLLQEVFYLLILSVFGQFCDQKGMLRIHGLALSYHDKAVLLVMPQGGGKSTMALAMLQQEDVKYISDDDPIFDRDGHILPFPRPLGIVDQRVIKTFPEEYVYKIDRMEFGIKYFVENDYWKDRIETKPLNDIVLLTGHKILNGTPSIEKRGIIHSYKRGSHRHGPLSGIGVHHRSLSLGSLIQTAYGPQEILTGSQARP